MKKEYSTENLMVKIGDRIITGYDGESVIVRDDKTNHEIMTEIKIVLENLESKIFVCNCFSCSQEIERLRNLK